MSKRTRQRKPTAANAALVGIAEKIYRGQELTRDERHRAYSLLVAAAEDVDIREELFESVRHRPAGQNQGARCNAAMEIALDRSAGIKLSSAIAAAAARWRLTEDVAKHSWREFGKGSANEIANHDHHGLRKVLEAQRAEMEKRRKGKK